MKRNERNPAWLDYLRQVRLNGYEPIFRLGNPLMIHKVNTPFTKESVSIVYFAHKSRREVKRPPRDPDDGFSKNQLKGIKIYKELGFEVSRQRMG